MAVAKQDIANVARALGDLREEVVFLGGSALFLLVTDPVVLPTIRPTEDVDVIIEVGSTLDYQVRLEPKLRSRGFSHVHDEDAPLCRWRSPDAIIVDVMPDDPGVLGFSNRWYRAALRAPYVLEVEGVSLNVISAPYFMATKFEAYGDRGGDLYVSKDLEDIITLIDGRAECIRELSSFTDEAAKKFISNALSDLLSDEFIHEALPGYLPGDDASQARAWVIIERIRALVQA